METTTIAEVKCIDVISTGKAHNSFFFLFKIEKILLGTGKDSMIISQELFSDFGGKQVREKISKGDFVILKFNKTVEPTHDQSLKAKWRAEPVSLLWLSEPSRWESFLKLEEKLSTSINPRTTTIDLLMESNGKLFYKENGIEKLAVEIFPGYWVTATLDK
jgi:hypothetical protein